jgi:hypothetical protein
MSNWRRKLAVKSDNLSNKELSELVPIFVDKTEPEDHKCGTCKFRIRSEDRASEGVIGAKCAVMEGTISMIMGTCAYWSFGNADSEKDRDRKLSKENAQYVEASFPIQCHTCKFYEDDWCHLWLKDVKDEQCCSAYDNEKLKWTNEDGKNTI